MKFSTKLLKQAGQEVYVLLIRDRDLTNSNEMVPIGVVTDESLANKFYGEEKRKDERNIVMFVLNEVPMLTGQPGTHEIPEPKPPLIDSDTQKRLDDADRRVLEAEKQVEVANRKLLEAKTQLEEADKAIRQLLEKLKSKRR